MLNVRRAGSGTPEPVADFEPSLRRCNRPAADLHSALRLGMPSTQRASIFRQAGSDRVSPGRFSNGQAPQMPAPLDIGR